MHLVDSLCEPVYYQERTLIYHLFFNRKMIGH